ncbi:substrate-binding domain-containing protein [Methanococcus voltae]|uniref:ABC-type molybdate transport system periplasmic component-like protein n=1 Tax=Methanococcus voltae (strain ATCC BAA-1334 / A3) TaxID=456320 RepID=D7DTJ9_METV3|nr:substrate-binding domain-containing protein [Methanococcus voltae]MCS3901311.1 molybdate transport system substrate-binding protein [Methanococcus voltae]
MKKNLFLVLGLISLTLLLSGCVSNDGGATTGEKTVLTVYSCGGPTEALTEVNKVFEQKYDCRIEFTGANAGKLEKALEAGAYADVFLPRTMTFSQQLVNLSLMNPDYKVYQFTDWVIITKKGNHKNITSLADLNRSDVIVYTDSKSSISSKKAMMSQSELMDSIYGKSAKDFDCYKKMLLEFENSDADATLVERRIITLPEVAGKYEVIELPRDYMTPQIGIFTVGVMNYTKYPELAYDYQNFVLSDEAEQILVKHGFVPVNFEEGQQIYKEYYSDYLKLNE